MMKNLFTGKDGETHDLGRWSWALSLGAVVAAGLHTAWTGHPIDLASFGTGIATVVGAHGFALYAKRDTEPEEKK